MPESLLSQIVKNRNGVEYSELHEALQSGGVLEHLDTDEDLQKKLKRELKSFDTSIQKTFMNLFISQIDISLQKQKKKENISNWEQKLLDFYIDQKSFFEKYVDKTTKKESKERLRFYKSTRDIIEETDLGKHPQMNEALSNRIDATRKAFIDSYGLE